jgi:hypothetical protein
MQSVPITTDAVSSNIDQGVFDAVYRHFQQYFSYIVTDRFIGGGNQRPGENNK